MEINPACYVFTHRAPLNAQGGFAHAAMAPRTLPQHVPSDCAVRRSEPSVLETRLVLSMLLRLGY